MPRLACPSRASMLPLYAPGWSPLDVNSATTERRASRPTASSSCGRRSHTPRWHGCTPGQSSVCGGAGSVCSESTSSTVCEVCQAVERVSVRSGLKGAVQVLRPQSSSLCSAAGTSWTDRTSGLYTQIVQVQTHAWSYFERATQQVQLLTLQLIHRLARVSSITCLSVQA